MARSWRGRGDAATREGAELRSAGGNRREPPPVWQASRWARSMRKGRSQDGVVPEGGDGQPGSYTRCGGWTGQWLRAV